MTANRVSLLAVFLLLSALSTQGHAQLSSEYYKADQMLQEQDFEEAYSIFKKLHEEDSQTYLYLEKATECLINMKRYDEAIELTKNAVEQENYSDEASIRLAEVYHFQGDKERAIEQWNQAIAEHPHDIQVYLAVARSQSDRQEFEQSVETFLQARENFSSSSFLNSELADTYMSAGKFREGIREYLKLIEENPSRINYVQDRLLNSRDDTLYSTATDEIGEFFDDLETSHPAYNQLVQLEMWLLLEQEEFEHAFSSAKHHEGQTEEWTYILFNLAGQLTSQRQFELAEEAYLYYTDADESSIQNQSLEQLADLYVEWADYLSDYSLAYAAEIDGLYQKAYDTLDELGTLLPEGEQLQQVLLKKAELAIDFMNDVELAENYLKESEDITGKSSTQGAFVEGRIDLFKQDYAQARVALTESNKQAGSDEMKEKTRYFLALTDFFSGDYEFAELQLGALERQTVSFFANDALQLRIWIQKGMAADSTGQMLKPFASAVEQFELGRYKEADEMLQPVLAEPYHPLAEEALMQLSRNITPQHAASTYGALNQHLEKFTGASGLRERLLWERAHIADQLLAANDPAGLDWGNSDGASTVETDWPDDVSVSTDEVIDFYEKILMDFPNGFYAPFARDRIRELQESQS